ncbi:MAG TPA: 50S ribosomal protein L28 [Sphingobacteriaceae bacterium]|nr:50S ribosomal protein L28 [Sphingobacteriaceae bacterium]
MARRCDICNKGVTTGNNVSHSNRHTRRTWSPNLQTVRVMVNGQRRKLRVCTRCIRSGRVSRV